ncbi:MAG: FAD-dependent thymidylate synthase, partial [Chloroflexota bacterium]
MAEAGPPFSSYARRVYPLDAHELTEEQIAVVFAMTSRRPEPFDEIARQVTQEKAADFHERWVLGYGHASVAEHAVLHLAVENVSRLACDTLEDNRLASYTEKSSRYQV